MQNNGINFTSYEKRIMKDTEFLLAKREITIKITKIFEELAKTLSSEPFYKTLPDALKINFQGAKISKGENYMGLPYLVLDHPRFFDKNNVFTFRAMFWWGNGYSFTLHLQGDFLKLIKPGSFSAEKFSKPTYISAGSSPWEYHYGEDNYVLLDNTNATKLFAESIDKGFLKLSRKIETGLPGEKVIEAGIISFREFVQELMI